jgi:hypothetical protein
MKSIAFGPALFITSTLFLAAPVFAQDTNAGAGSKVTDPANKDSKLDDKGAVTHAQVFFISPKNGATVKPEFTAKFGVKGMKVSPAGAVVPGEGHYHIIVDSGPMKAGEVVPTDATHLHYGKGQTEAKLTLTPGPHTLTLQFADGAHRSYGEAVSQTIKINVK